MSYKDNKRNMEYSIDQLLNSTVNSYVKEAFELYDNIALSGSYEQYELEDRLISRIKDKCSNDININNLVNAVAWIALLFPEI